MRVNGFMRMDGVLYAMTETADRKGLVPIPVSQIKGSTAKGSELQYDKINKCYVVVGEAVCASCGFDQLGGDNK